MVSSEEKSNGEDEKEVSNTEQKSNKNDIGCGGNESSNCQRT